MQGLTGLKAAILSEDKDWLLARLEGFEPSELEPSELEEALELLRQAREVLEKEQCLNTSALERFKQFSHYAKDYSQEYS